MLHPCSWGYACQRCDAPCRTPPSRCCDAQQHALVHRIPSTGRASVPFRAAKIPRIEEVREVGPYPGSSKERRFVFLCNTPASQHSAPHRCEIEYLNSNQVWLYVHCCQPSQARVFERAAPPTECLSRFGFSMQAAFDVSYTPDFSWNYLQNGRFRKTARMWARQWTRSSGERGCCAFPR